MIAGDGSIRELPVKKNVVVPIGLDFVKIRREPKGILNTSESGDSYSIANIVKPGHR